MNNSPHVFSFENLLRSEYDLEVGLSIKSQERFNRYPNKPLSTPKRPDKHCPSER